MASQNFDETHSFDDADAALDLDEVEVDEDDELDGDEVDGHDDLPTAATDGNTDDDGDEAGEVEDDVPTLDDEEDVEEEEESLEVLLGRAADDERLADEPRDGLASVDSIIAADEFTCRSCFLVKRRAQLADARKMICLDCA